MEYHSHGKSHSHAHLYAYVVGVESLPGHALSVDTQRPLTVGASVVFV